MSIKVSLKTQNLPLIILFLAWGVTLYILFITGIKDFWSDLISLFDKVNAKDGFLVSIAPLIIFILSHLIDANKKTVLVFWKLKNPLPGCRAFSEIGPEDPRIDMNVLKDKLNYIPADPAEQNKTWYKLYKQVVGTITVDSSHKNFLLARDLTSISFLFLIFTPWLILIIKNDFRMVLVYALIWFVQYLILCKVAQNTGERFVSNVLAEYCSKEPQKEEVKSGNGSKLL